MPTFLEKYPCVRDTHTHSTKKQQQNQTHHIEPHLHAPELCRGGVGKGKDRQLEWGMWRGFQQKHAGILFPDLMLAELWNLQAIQALLSEGSAVQYKHLKRASIYSLGFWIAMSTDQCLLFIYIYLQGGMGKAYGVHSSNKARRAEESRS